MNDEKNKIFQLVQDYLKPRPVIIWGSGATIPYGMPSMDEVKQILNITGEGNLEQILSDITDEEKITNYKNKIFKDINKRDAAFIQNINDDTFRDLKSIIKYFYNTHPNVLNVITTNYDCILEYLLAYYNFPFSDGFSGREQSSFNKQNFKNKECINIIKVHGSLRWEKNRYSYYNRNMQAIFPNNNKYREANQEPFRTLISKSDVIIENSKSFLVVGFGFNDEHLTPKIETAIKNDGQIVIVTKKATEQMKEKIQGATKFVLIEQDEDGVDRKTKFSYKINNENKECTLNGEFWKLENFKTILI